MLAALCASQPVFAQDSTSTIRGSVISADDGIVIAGAEVTLLHVPSGQQKMTLTNNDGNFAFQALAVGGPYTVTAEDLGFVTGEVSDVFLTAGRTRDINFSLKLSE